MPPCDAVVRAGRVHLLALLLTCGAVAPTTRPDVGGLISSLADRDPLVRARATQQLQEIGPPARDHLLAATRDPDPEVRTRAGAILSGLPLARPGDPAPVRKLLDQYRTADPSGRASFINEGLYRERDPAMVTVLQRILTEATPEDERWAAARVLRARRETRTDVNLRELDTTGRNVPLLITVAGAWQGRDSKRATDLMRRAVDVATERDTPLDPEVAGVADYLTDLAVQSRRFDDAASLLRRRARLGSATWPGATDPDVELIALHATHGPLPGLAQDLATLDPDRWTDPAVLYCAARALQRARLPLLAEAVAAVAVRWPGTSPARHVAVGQFLVEHYWDRWGRREFETALVEGADAGIAGNVGGIVQGGEYFSPADAELRLAVLAVENDDPVAAADHFERTVAALGSDGGQLVKTTRSGQQQVVGAEEIRVEAAVQRLRAARAIGDKKTVSQKVDELAVLPLVDIDVVSEVLPLLRERGRNADATAVFNRLYAEYKAALDADPKSPEALNNLAWLCARSGERAQEAIALSTKAVAADPDNAAYLDTAAEAHFRAGNTAEAVRLESQAVRFRPDDPFMNKQLKRFKEKAAEGKGQITSPKSQ